ncbi:MAG: hypothetical protein JSV06_04665 [Myxococcales bacterium]|nr:MAG: hypothetical protein JSV06_04665 [Myxococcales bacterium]
MRLHTPLVLLLLASFFALSCADDTVVRTGQIIVRFDPEADFEAYETFSVLTEDLVQPDEEPTEDQQRFNRQVNEWIVDAMQREPVCLEFVDPETVDETNQPDVFAANGLTVETGEGTVWQCIGGWWWGWWGWYWDPCKWIAPVPVEYDVGTMLIPVGPPPAEGEDAQPVFVGLAEALLSAGPVDEDRVREAVDAIFQQWPYKQTCSPPEE